MWPPREPDMATAATRETRLNLSRRPRRLRASAAIRSLVRETQLTPECLIYPIFVCEGQGTRKPIGSMPGIAQVSVDEALKDAAAARALGIPGVLLFGLPAHKDALGSSSSDPNGPVQTATRAFKKEIKDLVVLTDV